MKSNIALCLIASGAVAALALADCSSSSNTSDVNMANTPLPDMATTPPPPAATYSIGGDTEGMMGSGLVLQLNGANPQPVDTNGTFTFTKKLTAGTTYAVTVKSQPTKPSQTCTVVGGAGTVGAANVSQIAVTCVTNPYTVGGTVSGLTGSVVLQNNGKDDLTVTAPGAFTFATPLLSGTSYAVTVKTQPQNLFCKVTAGSGSVTTAAISDVAVTCATPVTCKDIKAANPAAADGNYMIDPDGGGPLPAITAFCDMTTDGGGYTEYAVTGGIASSQYTDPNSCQAVGLKLAISRTKAHITAMIAKYGMGYFTTVPGVYGMAAGNYTGCVMNSGDQTCGANWVAIDGGAWWARNTTYSEPNGDYTPGCWLGLFSVDGNGDLVYNDAGCAYSTGTSYICSDNAK